VFTFDFAITIATKEVTKEVELHLLLEQGISKTTPTFAVAIVIAIVFDFAIATKEVKRQLLLLQQGYTRHHQHTPSPSLLPLILPSSLPQKTFWFYYQIIIVVESYIVIISLYHIHIGIHIDCHCHIRYNIVVCFNKDNIRLSEVIYPFCANESARSPLTGSVLI
jgi:hypothetical protein